MYNKKTIHNILSFIASHMFDHLIFCIKAGPSSSPNQPLLVRTVRMWTRASIAGLAIGLGNITSPLPPSSPLSISLFLSP